MAIARSRVVDLASFGLLSLLAILALATAAPGPDRRDFFSFIASGRAVMEGTNPYDPSIDPTLTPPFTLPFLTLLARLDPWSAYVGWWIWSVALYLAVLPFLFRIYPERRSPLLFAWLLAWVPLWGTLNQGQVYMLLLVLVVVAWQALRGDRLIIAGVAIGILAALKPNFLFWPVLLWLAGVRRPAYVAVGVTAVLTVAPLAWYGPSVLPDWLTMGNGVAAHLAGTNGDMSLRSILVRLGTPNVGVVASALTGAALGWWAWRHRMQVDVSAVAIVGALVVAPVTWAGYGVSLLPILLHYRWNLPLWLAAALFTFPYGIGIFLLGGSVHAVALVLMLVGVLAARHHPTAIPIVAVHVARAAIPSGARHS